MGWGLGGFIDGIVDWVEEQFGNQAGDKINDQVNEFVGGQLNNRAWDVYAPPQSIRTDTPYTGSGYNPERSGWPIEIGVGAYGSPGVPPTGLFFIGHATPGMLFEQIVMTQSDADLAVDYEINAGFVARLVQRTESGGTNVINGFELGFIGGVLKREDLLLHAKSPLRARQTYGGPIEPFLPLFLSIQSFGDLGAVPGIETLQAQATATFLLQEPSATPSLVP